MRIVIKGIGFKLTEALKSFVREHLLQALARRTDAIQSVVVRLQDLNGARGGMDKCCRIQVGLLGRQLTFAEARHPDAYHAIIAASRQVGRTVNRSLDRHAHWR